MGQEDGRLERVAGILVVAAAALLLLPRLGSYSFVNADEAFYLAVSEHMVETGEWNRLFYRGEPRIYDTFLSAPLPYWLRSALIALLGGTGLWAARLSSALFGVATVAATIGLGRRLGGRRTGWLAGAVLLTTFQFVYLHGARTGELETTVTLLFVLAAWLFLRGVEGRSFWPHHLVLAVLVNVKLPLVLIPAAAELLYGLVIPAARSRLLRWLVTGIVLLPLAFAWHASQIWVQWDAFQGVAESMLGHAGGAGGLEHAGVVDQLGYYASVLVFGSYPWVFVFPVAGFVVLRRAGLRSAWLLPALFVLATAAFDLAVAKRAPWYVTPAYPFLALFAGHALARFSAGESTRDERLALGAALGLTIAASVAWLDFNPFAGAAFFLDTPWQWRSLGAVPAIGVAVGLAGIGAAALATVRAPRTAALVVVAGLLGVSGVRMLLPLRHLGHQSELATLHADLEALQARGGDVPYPIAIPSRNLMMIRYYFAGAHQLALAPPAARARGELYRLLPRSADAQDVLPPDELGEQGAP